MSQHTPGPWTDGHDMTVYAKGQPIAEALQTGQGKAHANARLIAAAPEMLAEIRELLRNLEYVGDGHARVFTRDAEALEALVAKVEG